MANLTLPPPTRIRYLVLAVLCAGAAIAYIHRSCISVPAKQIQEDLKLSKEDLGRIMSGFYLGYTLFQIPGGWLGDRWGTRLALSLLVLCWSAATGLMGLGGGFVLLFALWFINGMAQAGIFPCSVNTISHWFPASERGFPSGMLGSFMSMGAVIASALAGFLLQFLDWQWLFGVLALPGILFAAGFYLWFRNRPGEHSWVNQAEAAYIEREISEQSSAASPSQSWRALAGNYALYLVCGQQFFRAACYIFYVTWFPTYLRESRGVSELSSGILTSMPLIGVILGSASSGATIDWVLRRTGSRRWSRQGVGLTGVIGAALFLVLAGGMDAVAPTVALITASAFCAGFSGPAGYTITIDLAGKQVATVFSIMNMAGNLGATLCPLAVGHLIDRQEWVLVLLFLAGLYALSGVCWSFIPFERESLNHRTS